ncbi:hypothetical protein MKX03_018403 [Papaver bracteatum]|nr:hypothetical protein MKX03_018403 [Papaver bracteatum]
MACLGRRYLAGHYYPHYPEPNRTIRTKCHADPTILLHDQIGGLQVKHGEDWVDGKPLDGSLYRVVTNSFRKLRISVAILFNANNREIMYGPLLELVSYPQQPALYRKFTLEEFSITFRSNKLDGKSSLVDYFLL